MSCETAIYFRVAGEEAVDGGDGLTFTLHGRNAQADPAPVVYVDGEAADSGTYTFSNGNDETPAAITFTDGHSYADKTVLCDYRWKYECGPGEELSVFEMEKELNVRTLKDANGRTMLVESRVKTTGWRGALAWDYMSQEFWEEIRRLVESAGCAIDVERSSLGTPLDTIENLYPVKYPKFKETPGVPGLTNVSLEVVQIETAS